MMCYRGICLTLFRMRRIFSIFLIFLVMMSHTEVIQLFKLPALYAHYLEHREENKEMGLIGYILLHYRDSRHSANPHEQLPFKTCHNTQSSVAFNIPCMITVIQETRTDEPSNNLSCIPMDEDLLPETLRGSVFQPPKSLA